jgi:quercetin dioxygenase-like cupin family protein
MTDADPHHPMTATAKEAALDAPDVRVDLSAVIARLRAEDTWRRDGHSGRTVVKHADLRVVVMALRKGARIPAHAAAARISIQTLSGHVRLTLADGVADLPMGHLLALGRSAPHDVEAIEDSAILLTLAWGGD